MPSGLPLEIHAAVFQWVLTLAAEKKLLPGNTVAVDATTLEPDAAMKSIVRRRCGIAKQYFKAAAADCRESLCGPCSGRAVQRQAVLLHYSGRSPEGLGRLPHRPMAFAVRSEPVRRATLPLGTPRATLGQY